MSALNLILRVFSERIEVSNRYFCLIGSPSTLTASVIRKLSSESHWQSIFLFTRSPKSVELEALGNPLETSKVIAGFRAPSDISSLMRIAGVPPELGFLSLRTNSFEFEYLKNLLGLFRPAVIAVRINERFSPPIRFFSYFDAGLDNPHLELVSGGSISAFEDLLTKNNYGCVQLSYNELLAIPFEFEKFLADFGLEIRPAAYLYKTGFLDMQDRLKILPENIPFEGLLFAEPHIAMGAFDRFVRVTAPDLRFEMSC